MARKFYGGGSGDLVAQITTGFFAPASATFDVFTTRTGATQHSSLQTWAGVSITQATSDANGVVRFQGNDGYTGSYWLQDVANPTAERIPVQRVDVSDTAGGAIATVNGDAGPAVVLDLGDISGVTLTSPTAGQVVKMTGTANDAVNGSLALDDLSDVVVGAHTAKFVPVADGTNFVARQLTLNDVAAVVVTGTPAAGRVARFNGTNLVDAALDADDLTGLAAVAQSGSYSDLSNKPTAPTQELYEAVTTGYPTRAPTQYPRGLHKGPTKPTDGNSIDGDIWQKFSTAFPEVP